MPMTADIDYVEAGDGPPVICLHGIGGDALSFQAQLEGLRGVRVISWCMPGYRGSPLVRPLTFEALALKLAGFMDALEIDAAHLCGHSIGGMVAQDFAVRHPSRVASLALIGTTPSFGGRDPSFAKTFLQARLGPLSEGAEMADLARAAAPQITGAAASPDCVAKVEATMAAVPEATWRAILNCLIRFNRRDDLGAMTAPACLIAGSEDQNAPSRTVEKMAAAMPDAEYHLIEGAGHMIAEEAPDETNAILNRFYERLA